MRTAQDVLDELKRRAAQFRKDAQALPRESFARIGLTSAAHTLDLTAGELRLLVNAARTEESKAQRIDEVGESAAAEVRSQRLTTQAPTSSTSKEWCVQAAELERDCEVGIGREGLLPSSSTESKAVSDADWQALADAQASTERSKSLRARLASTESKPFPDGAEIGAAVSVRGPSKRALCPTCSSPDGVECLNEPCGNSLPDPPEFTPERLDVERQTRQMESKAAPTCDSDPRPEPLPEPLATERVERIAEKYAEPPPGEQERPHPTSLRAAWDDIARRDKRLAALEFPKGGYGDEPAGVYVEAKRLVALEAVAEAAEVLRVFEDEPGEEYPGEHARLQRRLDAALDVLDKETK
jgi:hypothetical protein